MPHRNVTALTQPHVGPMPLTLKHALKVAAGSMLVATCAHVALPLPFSPVPLTLQTFAVLLIGRVYTPRVAMQTMLLYLAEGACHLPVFAPTGVGGLAQLLGPTGGYLLSYPLMAVVASSLSRNLRVVLSAPVAALAAGACAILLNLTMGAVWLAVILHMASARVLMLSVLPFLPGEAVKLLAAAGIAGAWMNLRRQSLP